MHTLVLTLHFIACFLLIIVVLIQDSKGSAMGIFGGGGSDALFSAGSGTSFIKKFTMALALFIVVTSIMLTASVSKQRSSSVFDTAASSSQTAPSSAPVSNTPAQTGK